MHRSRPLAANVYFDAASVSVIDTDSDEVVARVPVGEGPPDVTWSADGRFAYVTNFLDSRTRPARIGAAAPSSHRPEAVNSTLSAPTAVHSSSNGPDETVCPGAHETSWSPTRRSARPSCTPLKEIVVPKTVALEPPPASVTEHEFPEQDTRLTEKELAEAAEVAAVDALPPGEPGAPGEPDVPADPGAPGAPDAPAEPGEPGEPEPPAPPEPPAAAAPEDVPELPGSAEPAQAVSRTSSSTPARTPEQGCGTRRPRGRRRHGRDPGSGITRSTSSASGDGPAVTSG